MLRRNFPNLVAQTAQKSVQIFGISKSQATRAAERFFKERRIQIHFVDLSQKPMSPGEIKRFLDKFTLAALIDRESKPYVDAGLQYMRIPDPELLRKIEHEPKLLKLPLIRCGNLLSVGHDEAAWKQMLA
jgi:arsenate reductase (glutaredoxin)